MRCVSKEIVIALKRCEFLTGLLVFILISSVFFPSCDDDDDDDDDVAADDDTSPWPDHTKPVVGWFATSISCTSEGCPWGHLYKITEDGYQETDPPGEYAFYAGSLPKRNLGWALNRKDGINELYQWDGEAWTLFDPQPPCAAEADFDGLLLRSPFLFEDGSGYVLCREGTLLEWDGAVWKTHEIPTDSFATGIDCLDKDQCVLWNGGAYAYWWNGTDFSKEWQGTIDQMVLQDEHLSYSLAYFGDGDQSVNIYVRRDGDWDLEEEHFPDYDLSDAIIARIDNAHTAIAFVGSSLYSDISRANLVLRSDGTVIDQSWQPTMWYKSFGKNGGGLGACYASGAVYRLAGRSSERIFSWISPERYSMILAADAE